MRIASIYVLTPLASSEVRYVGKTISRPASRLSLHLHEALRGGAETRCARWIRSLGGAIRMQVILECSASRASESEIAAIAAFRKSGCRLTNLTNGGDGGSGPKSPETRDKIRLLATGRRLSEETRAKMSASRRGRPHSAEWAEKVAARHRGMKRSASARLRMKIAAMERVIREGRILRGSFTLGPRGVRLPYPPITEDQLGSL